MGETQFSLRALLTVTTLLAIDAALLSWYRHSPLVALAGITAGYLLCCVPIGMLIERISQEHRKMELMIILGMSVPVGLAIAIAVGLHLVITD